MKKGYLSSQLHKIPYGTRVETWRFVLSFILAWAISILFNDFPFFSSLIQESQVNATLTSTLVKLTQHQLELIGFSTIAHDNFLQIIGTPGVRFEYSCLGIRHIMLFLLFIAFHMGKWYKKITYGLFGTLMLIWINSLRAVFIAISQVYTENTTLVHDISTPIFMYISILILWIYWANTMGRYRKA